MHAGPTTIDGRGRRRLRHQCCSLYCSAQVLPRRNSMLRGDEANIKLLAVCDPSLSNSAYKAMSFGKQEGGTNHRRKRCNVRATVGRPYIGELIVTVVRAPAISVGHSARVPPAVVTSVP